MRSLFRRCLICSLVLWPMYVAAEGLRVEVLANASVPEEFLARDQLRAAYSLRTWVWPDGQPITLYVLEDSNELHREFCRDVLGTFPYILRSVWDRVLFSGTGTVPIRVESLREMENRVMATPGAVGYRWRRADEGPQQGDKP